MASMRRSTARPVVDLPQPLSPTRPRVSPFSTEKLTPSTAYTVPVWRLRTPDLIGKCFLRSRTSSRLTTPPLSRSAAACSRMDRALVDGDPAADAVVRADDLERRPLVAALRALVGAAADERAARGQRDEVRRLPLDGREPRLLGHVESRQRAQQPPRVRVVRVVEDLVDGAVLDGAAAVHDHDLVGDLGHHAEVVGDGDDAALVPLLHLADDVDDLRLDGDVQRRGGLVGDEDVGVAADGHGDHGALAHAAGELERVLVDALLGVGDADPVEQLRRPSARPRPCSCPGAG